MTRKKHKKSKKSIGKYLTRAKTNGGVTIDKNTKATQTTYTKPICHKGNTAVYQDPETNAKLYIGGWNNGAEFDWNTHVIDLTGMEHKYWDIPIAYDDDSKAFLPFVMQTYAGWLSLPFPDYQTPASLKTLAQWEGITDTIRGILHKGHDVLVACHGGHGRSGLFISIVGYLLNIDDDPTWASPVEKLRQIHCDEAVETYAQEKYVYDILGLRLKPRHVYDDDYLWYGRGATGTQPVSSGAGLYSYNVGSTFRDCPICHTQSLYVDEYGMCMTCRNRYADDKKQPVPVRDDLTLEDISEGGLVPHTCTEEKCMGIWQASKCGHITHNMIIYEGFCENCYKKYEDEMEYAEQKLKENNAQRKDEQEFQLVCANCGKPNSVSVEDFGICFECATKLSQNKLVTDVHNTITDPYKFIPHSHCEDEHLCVGIVKADVCGHVVHNREVEEGLCPKCYFIKHGPREVN